MKLPYDDEEEIKKQTQEDKNAVNDAANFEDLNVPPSANNMPITKQPTPISESEGEPISPEDQRRQQLKDYLINKFSPENREALANATRGTDALGYVGAGLEGLGSIISGSGNPGDVVRNHLKARQDLQRQQLADFDATRAPIEKELSLMPKQLTPLEKAKQAKIEAESARIMEENDPDSPASTVARALYTKNYPGMSFDGMSAKDLKNSTWSLISLAQNKAGLEKAQLSNDIKKEISGNKIASAEKITDTKLKANADLTDKKLKVQQSEGDKNRDNRVQVALLNQKDRIEARNQRQALADRLTPKQTEEISGLDTLLNSVDKVNEEKNKLDTGILSSKTNELAHMIGTDDPKFSAFRAAVNMITADYIKGISGAAVSDEERAFLLKNVPQPNDNDEVFMAKLNTLRDKTLMIRKVKLDNFAKSGKNTSNFDVNKPIALKDIQQGTAPVQSKESSSISITKPANRNALPKADLLP